MTSLVLWAQHRVFASARGSSPSRDRVIDEETDGGSTQAHDQVKHIIRSVHMHQTKQPLAKVQSRNETRQGDQ